MLIDLIVKFYNMNFSPRHIGCHSKKSHFKGGQNHKVEKQKLQREKVWASTAVDQNCLYENISMLHNCKQKLKCKNLQIYNCFLISVMSNRPLRDGELFEIQIERMVERWSGSIEAGVTLIRQDQYFCVLGYFQC